MVLEKIEEQADRLVVGEIAIISVSLYIYIYVSRRQ